MTNLGILARFPLGVYQGHKADGSPDAFPDPARLQAALLSAAAQDLTQLSKTGSSPPRKNHSRPSNGLRRTPDRATASRHVPRVPLTQQDEPIHVPRSGIF